MSKTSQGLLTVILGLVCLAGLTGGPALADDNWGAEGSVTVLALDHIIVTPANRTVTLVSGTTPTVRYYATGNYTDGTTSQAVDITGSAIWASSDNSVATIDSTGLATILSTGSTIISANYTGVTGDTTLRVDSSRGGGGGGGGGGSGDTISLLEYVDSTGRFYSDTVIESSDRMVSLLFKEDSTGRSRTGQRLRYISIKEDELPGELLANQALVGPVYDIGPDGATFRGTVYLTLRYDDADLTVGSSEKRLGIVTWEDGEWMKLGGLVIDPDKNKITTMIQHLSYFAVVVGTAPASFRPTNLQITPTRVNTGDAVSVSIDIYNSGDISGSYTVNLRMSTLITQQKVVTLDGGETRTVTFTFSPPESGQYTVEVSGLSGSLIVSEPQPEGTIAEIPEETTPAPSPAPASFTISDLSVTPGEVERSEEVTVSAVVTNTGGSDGSYSLKFKVDNIEEGATVLSLGPGKSEVISFTTSKDTPGKHTIDINGYTGEFTVKTPALLTGPAETTPEQPTTNRWPLVGIFSGLLLAVVILFVLYKKLT